MSHSAGDPGGAPRPNELRNAAAPNVLNTATSGSAMDPGNARRPTASGLLLPAAVLLGGLLFLAVAPRFLDEIAITRDPCAVVDDLLAESAPEPFDVEPVEWMPRQMPAGFEVTENRPTTLETVVAGRVNPEASRIELLEDGFVDGYEQFWDGPTYNISFTAQRFASTEGALAFQAFANQFACQFANETFVGPRRSIGLQIRYGEGPPIGEQVSWVSGTTRVLVAVRHPAPPPDHQRIESATALVGIP